jgi:Fur family ferric uptake transcriptional regulator
MLLTNKPHALQLKMIFIMDTQSWLDALQKDGCRLTGARCAVVETMAHAQTSLTPLEVYDQARRDYHRLGLVTVYRTLEKLEELRLIQRVHQPGGCNAYISSANGHQHLLICQSCGKAVYFEGDDLIALFDKVGRQTDFEIKDHWLQLYGICSKCKTP